MLEETLDDLILAMHGRGIPPGEIDRRLGIGYARDVIVAEWKRGAGHLEEVRHRTRIGKKKGKGR